MADTTAAAVILVPAGPEDVRPIVDLLEPYARQELVLARTAEEIGQYIANFTVAKAGDRVVGCVALRDFGDGLEEVRSLAVESGWSGHGLGSKLVQAALEHAVRRQANRVFALTLRPHLFERLGFVVVDKEMFPQKVWSDCRKCSKLACCDETALLIKL